MTMMEEAPKILILVSNKHNERLLREELSNHYNVLEAKDSIQDLDIDLIIVDGVELKKRQKEIAEYRKNSFPVFLPVILLSTKHDIRSAEKFFYEVIDDFISVPIEKVELIVRIDVMMRVRCYTGLLYEETVKDPLTRVYNRKHFYETLDRELEQFKRYGETFSLVFIDIDNFKQINDRYGHISGDIVLKTVARKIQESVRTSDMVFRFGGEEFVVLLRKTYSEQATLVAERIRQEIANTSIELLGNNDISVTISAGIATSTEDIKSLQELVDRADFAMYQAKKLGKNKVFCR